MEMIENRMADDLRWPEAPPEIKEKLNGPGWKGIGVSFGMFVPEEDAFDYAIERISQDQDLKQEFIEWFYSGSFAKEE